MRVDHFAGVSATCARAALSIVFFLAVSSLSFTASAEDISYDYSLFQNPGMVVSRVWDDLDRDGMQGSDEPGIAGVRVNLYTCAGRFVMSRKTNEYGAVALIGEDGCHQLEYEAMEGYRYCPDGLGNSDLLDSDANPSTRITSDFNIHGGGMLLDIDAGAAAISQAQIGDRVWHDLDADGVQDMNEPGLSGVSMELQECSGAPVLDDSGYTLTAVSAQDGSFMFDGLNPGCYRIQSNLPDDYTLSPKNAGSDTYNSDFDAQTGLSGPVQISQITGMHNVDAGVFKSGSVGNRVWFDSDGNGMQDAGESGLDGITVLLLDSYGAPTGVTTVTDAEGYFAFTDLAPGSYHLQIQTPVGMAVTIKDAGDSDEMDNDANSLGKTARFTLDSGESSKDIDAGLRAALVLDVALEARTNGEDADDAPGPYVEVGGEVLWEYVVSNVGTLVLYQVTVDDDQLGMITCPGTQVNPDSSMTCTAMTDDAQAGQYVNTATACGTDGSDDPPTVCAMDSSHYFGSDPSIGIEVWTQGEDADNPTGPLLPVGAPVTWEYFVTNTGNVPLSGITVIDDQGVTVTCPVTEIDPGVTITCDATGTVTEGQYANVGTAFGTPPVGPQVSNTDPSHYFGAMPGLSMVKFTDGEDAATPPGPVIAPGNTVTWTYEVTNTGNVALFQLTVSDDQGVVVSCPTNAIQPGQTITCEGSGPAVAGQYMNIGTACAMSDETQVCDTDTSHYFGLGPMIDIETFTRGVDADTPTGPTILAGNGVTWDYIVTNSGGTTLENIVVTDSEGAQVSCPLTTLEAGETMNCSASGVAIVGQYMNVGTACGIGNNETVCDEDPSHYFGIFAAIDLEKYTNGVDADTPPGVEVITGSAIEWRFEVTNTGNVDLIDITVVDDQLGMITCPQTSLAAGASMDCFATGVAIEGQYANLGSTCGLVDEDKFCDDDPSHYFGVTPGILIEKSTNGVDADVAPGPYLAAGAAVNWTYTVTNTGNAELTDLEVTDDQGVIVTCPVSSLQPGASTTCTGSGTATAGQYMNTGTACANFLGEQSCAIDPSNYFGVAGGVEIQKSTNGQDADTPTGPVVAIGMPVNWLYTVSNTGNVDLINVSVTDDQGVAVSCPSTTVAVGASMECTGSGVAQAGQYSNIGTVNAQGVDADGNPVGDPLTASDPSHYFGGSAGLTIEKSTNGEDADSPTGPTIAVGDTVNWVYTITNTGNLALNNVSVTDDQGVAVSCPSTTLAVGASMDCTGSGTAQAGQYSNIGTASAQGVDPDGNPVGDPVSDTDPSHYFGGAAGLTVEKSTNGEDADTPTGPVIAVGATVNWLYTITNTGNIDLANVSVSDDQGVVVSCPSTTIAVGASMECTGSGVAQAGQYSNIGSASAQGIDPNGDPVGDPVGDTDPSHYFGGEGSLTIEKSTNGQDADTPTGPTIAIGAPVNWVYTITNTGNLDLTNVTVTDDQGVVVSCPATTVAVGATMECTGSGIAQAGQYSNIGTASAQSVDPDGNPVGAPVSDTDPSHYFGGVAGLTIEKSTNGQDADTPTGPTIAVGDAVNWVYTITNTGNVALSNVTVTDDQGVAVSCPSTTLAVGASMDCTGSGVAQAGQYSNIGSASAQGVDDNGNPVGDPVSGSDPSHYFGGTGSVVIEKTTNGQDADTPTGPTIAIGAAVNWVYSITNTGNLDLINVSVTDDQGVIVTCPMTTLNAGATMECTGTGVAQAGQYSNIGTVTAQGVDPDGNPIGSPVTNSDPSHYFGGNSGLDIEKFTNGVDADTPTGPEVTVGEPIEWTYVLTNTGNLDLINVTVVDDQGVAVSCPSTTLSAGAEMTCTGNGVATLGQYSNIGTVSAQGVDPDGNPIGDPVSNSDPSHYLGLPLPTASLGDLVFSDLDRDGVQDVNEPGVAGATVNLWTDDDGDGLPDTQIASTTTDANGNYLFPNLDSSLVYIVQFPPIPGMPLTQADQGGDPALDSNPNPATGITGPINLQPGQSDLTIDAGVITLMSSMTVEKSTNGQDADTPSGPEIAVGEAVEWTYLIANTGELDIDNISVSDDQGVVVTCPATFLAAGDSFTCTGEGVAVEGQYSNLGTVSGQPVDDGTPVGPPVSDDDPSHYLGVLAGCVPGFVKDHFNHVSYSNNDGDMDWTGDWKEHDPQGGGAASGNVMIADGQLILNDYPDSGQNPSIRRAVDLSGYVSAMLMFDWSISEEANDRDKATIDIKTDGGNWVTLATYEGEAGQVTSGSAMFDISAYISSNTEIRFRIKNKFGAVWDKFMVDYVRIDKKCDAQCTPGFVKDHFSHVNYGNNDGDMDWTGEWKEHDPQGGGAASGNVMIANGQLILNDYPDSGQHPSIRRAVDLSGYSSAMLMFDWSISEEANDRDKATIDIKTDDGSWVTLATYEGEAGQVTSGSAMFDISAYISSNTEIRFRIKDKFGAVWDKFMVNYVRIDKKCEPPVDEPQSCVVEETPYHAVYLPNFNNDGVLDLYDIENGSFVQNIDGTATLTGIIRKQNEPSYAFSINVTMSGRTDTPPPGSPYNPHNANPADWQYYPDWDGVFTGIDWNAGAQINLERRGAAFQIGTGANAHSGEQDIYGGSGWFDFWTVGQPNDCDYYNDCIAWDGHGDINIRLDCPAP